MRYSAYKSISNRMSWAEMMVKKQKETGFVIVKETIEKRDEIISKYASKIISTSSSYVES
jgi:hypothetical protein